MHHDSKSGMFFKLEVMSIHVMRKEIVIDTTQFPHNNVLMMIMLPLNQYNHIHNYFCKLRLTDHISREDNILPGSGEDMKHTHKHCFDLLSFSH